MQMGTLRVFCDVIETGSVSRAARKNGRTTANASQLFQALEDEFCVQFAVRDARHFQLTPEGEVCHVHCREIFRLHRELERQMQLARETSANIFDLAACFSFGLHQLQPILRQFRQVFPRIQVQVRYDHIDRVHELVLHNEVDLGLVAYPRRRPGLAVEHVRDERLVLVCHPQHRFAGRPAVPLTALRSLPIIAWQEIPWVTFLKKVPDSQRHLFESRHVFNEVEMVKQAVERDVGVAVLPAATVESEVANHLLAAVPFEDGRHTKPVAVIYRKNRKLTPAMKNFIQALKQQESEACRT
jgi:DNA-binding transcriptional LysR family regulator